MIISFFERKLFFFAHAQIKVAIILIKTGNKVDNFGQESHGPGCSKHR